MKKIKINDTVIVLTGKDKGRSGKIIKFFDHDRILVEGVNMIKKHVKPNPNKNTKGGIVEKESLIHVSNIALLNPVTNKADKIGFKFIEASSPSEKPRKTRYFKSNNEMVDSTEK